MCQTKRPILNHFTGLLKLMCTPDQTQITLTAGVEIYSWCVNFPACWRHILKSVSIDLSHLHRTRKGDFRLPFTPAQTPLPLPSVTSAAVLHANPNPTHICVYRSGIRLIPQLPTLFPWSDEAGGYPIIFLYCSIPTWDSTYDVDSRKRPRDKERIFLYWLDGSIQYQPS